MSDIQSVKQRFGIIGNNSELNHSIEVALEVAVTDMSVLVTGESGVGKEVFSKIIHYYSPRKHNKYIAVNCGAIPEGTIESELFGHVKGAFTGADRERKGYFAEADGGTIFLDEVGELPLNMQVKLLRVLQNGEYLPVGSSKTMHTDVRVVAATNVNLLSAIEKGKFREDLYYRLNQITINIPPLRERKDDVYMLFKRFAVDQAEKYNMPHISLTAEAREYLKNYSWQGNVRQLKNVAEQISIIEKDREIDANILRKYLPQANTLPMIVKGMDYSHITEDEAFNTLLRNKQDIDNLKREVSAIKTAIAALIKTIGSNNQLITMNSAVNDYSDAHIADKGAHYTDNIAAEELQQVEEMQQNTLDGKDITKPKTIAEMEKDAIFDALKRHNGHRGEVAKELGISARTLYRKIAEYNL